MDRKFSKPLCEILKFLAEDVICTSGGEGGPNNGNDNEPKVANDWETG